MAALAFIGLGNMGGPMLRNLIKAGHAMRAFDPAKPALDAAAEAGAVPAASAAAAFDGSDGAITMLPAGEQARAVYLGGSGLIARAKPGAILIDCSTIDIASARAIHEAAADAGVHFVDAPVSGGVAGAAAASLTFMAGGSDAAFAAAEPILKPMGKAIYHAGGPGAGQAAKICNNMVLAVSMIGVAEAFALGEKLGLSAERLFEIMSVSSGQCWSLTSYCPVPGPVPASPANRNYAPGFAAPMMLKDLKLAQGAARDAGVATPLGAGAAQLYQLFVVSGGAEKDFSGIIEMLRGRAGVPS